jgi:hypothetical protein
MPGLNGKVGAHNQATKLVTLPQTRWMHHVNRLVHAELQALSSHCIGADEQISYDELTTIPIIKKGHLSIHK